MNSHRESNYQVPYPQSFSSLRTSSGTKFLLEGRITRRLVNFHFIFFHLVPFSRESFLLLLLLLFHALLNRSVLSVFEGKKKITANRYNIIYTKCSKFFSIAFDEENNCIIPNESLHELKFTIILERS